MDMIFVQNTLLSIVLGFMLGLQREMHVKHSNKSSDFGGARTFSIISLFGFLSAYTTSYVPYLLLASLVFMAVILGSAYIINNLKSQEMGTTTEFAAIISFFVGAILFYAPMISSVFITIVVLFMLNIKEKLQEYEKIISPQDISSMILFLMMTFVVLPILPDKAIDMWNLINPHQIWLMVVLVAGISFFGYIAVRFFGTKHGIGITGLLGGLVSSTAVTISMSKKAIDNSSLSKNLALAITLASSVMLFRAWIEIFLIHRELAYTITWAVIIATLSGYSVIAYLFFTANKSSRPS